MNANLNYGQYRVPLNIQTPYLHNELGHTQPWMHMAQTIPP